METTPAMAAVYQKQDAERWDHEVLPEEQFRPPRIECPPFQAPVPAPDPPQQVPELQQVQPEELAHEATLTMVVDEGAVAAEAAAKASVAAETAVDTAVEAATLAVDAKGADAAEAVPSDSREVAAAEAGRDAAAEAVPSDTRVEVEGQKDTMDVGSSSDGALSDLEAEESDEEGGEGEESEDVGLEISPADVSEDAKPLKAKPKGKPKGKAKGKPKATPKRAPKARGKAQPKGKSRSQPKAQANKASNSMPITAQLTGNKRRRGQSRR